MSFREFNSNKSDNNSGIDIISDLRKRKNSSIINSLNQKYFKIEEIKQNKINYDLFNIKISKSEISITEDNQSLSNTLISNNPSPSKNKNKNKFNFDDKFSQIEQMFQNQKETKFVIDSYKLNGKDDCNCDLNNNLQHEEFYLLNNILNNLFCCNKFINNKMNIKKFHIDIINSIIKRKYGETIEEYFKQEENVTINKKWIEDLENIFSLTYKRKEENFKLIIKTSIKHMFKNYLLSIKVNNNLKKRKKNITYMSFIVNIF